MLRRVGGVVGGQVVDGVVGEQRGGVADSGASEVEGGHTHSLDRTGAATRPRSGVRRRVTEVTRWFRSAAATPGINSKRTKS
jgi:hypothetical protein